MKKSTFTSEAVTEGHPDKVCDLLADTILDEALRQDPNSRMAVEATIKDELIFIYGEMNSKAEIDFEKIAKNVMKKVGYDEEYSVITKVGLQSKEISDAVKSSLDMGAGDQGIMFGYACDDTEELMPAAIHYANLLAKKLHEVCAKSKILKPDGKTQVTVLYKDGVLSEITNIVVSTQHIESAQQEEIKKIIMDEVIYKTIPEHLLSKDTIYLINPSGSFIKGGSFGDSGTTGRKIVCDSYGGYGRVGGGCFSSKDPSKVDRSAAYYCRYVAKSIVANHLASKCEIGVSYAIGKSNPLSLFIETFDTNKISEDELLNIVQTNFDFSVSNIVKELDLIKPIYAKVSNYGHFGRAGLSWEEIKILKIDEETKNNMKKITELLLYNTGVINFDEIEEYSYGIEVFFLKMIHYVTFLSIGYLYHGFFEMIVFLFVFNHTRSIIGGYHAKTRLLCFAYSLAMGFTLCSCINQKFIPNYVFLLGSLILMLMTYYINANLNKFIYGSVGVIFCVPYSIKISIYLAYLFTILLYFINRHKTHVKE